MASTLQALSPAVLDAGLLSDVQHTHRPMASTGGARALQVGTNCL